MPPGQRLQHPAMPVFASNMHQRHRSSWRCLTAALACALLSACVLRPPQSSEETMVDSVIPGDAVGAGITGKPFCLHLRYRNHFFSAYSDSRVAAWVTDGSCAAPTGTPATPAAKRQVGTIRIGWWYDWEDHQKNRQCMVTDHCEIDAQNVILGRNIRCAVAQVADGPYTAFVTTDTAVCH